MTVSSKANKNEILFWLSILASSFLFLGSFTQVLMGIAYRTDVNHVKQRARDALVHLRDVVPRLAPDALQEYIQSVGREPETFRYLLVMDRQGLAIAHSNPARKGMTFYEEGLQKVVATGQEVEQIYNRDAADPASPYHGEKTVDFLAPYYALDGRLAGVVNVGLAVQTIEQLRRKYLAMTLAGAALWLILLTVFVFISMRYVTARKHAEVIRASEETLATILHSINAGVVIVDPDAHVIEQVNTAAAELFGAAANQIVGQVCHCFLCPAQEEQCPITDLRQEIDQADRLMLRADGGTVPILKSVKRISLMGREKLIETFIDITERKRAEEALRESETNFRTFFNTIHDFLFILDAQGNIQEFNQTVAQRLGYAQTELRNQSVLLVHPANRRAEVGQIVAEMLQGTRDYCPVPLITKAGRLIPVETYITKGLWNGKPALFGVSKDISALKRSEEKFAKAFHSNPAIAGLSDIETGEYVEVNQTFYDTLGFTPAEVIGKKATDVLRLDRAFREKVLGKLKKQGFLRNEEAVLTRKNGTPITVLLSAELLELQDKIYDFTTAVDITARKQAEMTIRGQQEQLIALSRIDELTGVFSRRYFMERSTDEIWRCKRSQQTFSISIVDLDYFKKINDAYGHLTGDAVLKAVAAIIQKSIRRTDYIGRYGGDEFMIVLVETEARPGHETMARHGQKIDRIRAAIRNQPLIQEHAAGSGPGEVRPDLPPDGIQVTATFGVALFDQTIASLSELLEKADRALYLAKEKGRNRTGYYFQGSIGIVA